VKIWWSSDKKQKCTVFFETQCSSGFLFVDVTVFGRSKSIKKPNFVNISQFVAQIITSVFEKQMSAILKFYFRFWFWFYHTIGMLFCRWIVDAQFHPNQTTYCGNMRSYRFLKLLPVSYLLMPLPLEGHSLWANQISSTQLNSQTSAILEFYFQFQCGPFRCNWRDILYHGAEFHQNLTIHCGNMTSYRFLWCVSYLSVCLTMTFRYQMKTV